MPGLCDLVRDGNPTYAWDYADRHVWTAPNALLPRVLSRLTSSRVHPRTGGGREKL